MMEISTRTGTAPLQVAVIAADPVREADLAARVAIAGHTVTDLAEADVVLADPGSPVAPDQAVLRAGLGGMVPADLSPAQLDAALRAVSVGLRVSLPAPPDGFAPAGERAALLTPRELEILACLGEGLSNKAVARRLGISAHTVKFHLEAVFAKLGAASRADAVARGLRGGLILL
jgi:two-component system nitrate/nitrite response regulator NarL